MPTSTFSMFSSSKGVDGFFGLICVVIQMVLTVVLSEPKTEFTPAGRATATVKVVYQPTKCALSNGTGSFPYVAAMGYAAIVSSGLVYILRAKRVVQQVPPPASHADKDPGTGDRPPSPPSDADTESNAKKRPNRWLRLLLIFLIWMVFLSLGAALFVAYLERTPQFVGQLLADVVIIFETGLSHGWSSIASTIHLHGQRYSKFFLLASTSHCVCIIMGLVFRRARRRTVSLVTKYLITETEVVITYIPAVAVAIFPQLNWIYWMIFYPTALAHHVIMAINWILNCVQTFLFKFDAEDLLMVLGPLLLHTLAMCFWTVSITLRGAPFVTKATIWHLSSRRRNIHGAATSLGVIAVFVLYFAIAYSLIHRTNVNDPLWAALYSPKAREGVWYFIRQFRTWKSVQLAKFAVIMPKLQRIMAYEIGAACRTWGTLHWPPKLLILAPAFIFYLHFDLAHPIHAQNLSLATSAPNVNVNSAQILSVKCLARNVTKPAQAADPSMFHPLPDRRAQNIPAKYTTATPSANPTQVALANIPAEYTPNAIHTAQVAPRRIYPKRHKPCSSRSLVDTAQ
ncbi:hypothetical protein C8F04DRAFT_1255154 [Mycena alexandri]|uniref:Uncharacterized protein n=1 Tax=Mycena alexandri TaxID=1745969 RepID=A0AAD6T441_9AGAR|nr:hypothetical protein C8F04DRAFT_1255154 [Mycena alexandri]